MPYTRTHWLLIELSQVGTDGWVALSDKPGLAIKLGEGKLKKSSLKYFEISSGETAVKIIWEIAIFTGLGLSRKKRL